MRTVLFAIMFIAAAVTGRPGEASNPSEATQPVSQRGIPGEATSHAVVNVADLPGRAESDSAPASLDLFAPAAPTATSPPENLPPAPASSFLGLLKIPADDPPPDSHGAVGPNHIVTSVNDRLRIQDRAGETLQIISFENFWRPILGQEHFCCDGRILYDPYGHRWIIVGLSDGSAGQQSTLLGVTQGPDPLGHWNLYRIVGDPSNTIYPDYPRIGFNKDWIVVQALMIRMSDNFLIGFDIYAVSRTNLYVGGPGRFTKFTQRTDFIAAHPVTTYDPDLSTFYLVSAPVGPARYGVEGTTNLNELRIYTITGSIGAEVLTEHATIQTPFRWDGEPRGGFLADTSNRNMLPQLGSPKLIGAHPAAIYDAKYRNGTLWAVQPVLMPPGGSPTRSSVQWWQLGLDGTVLQHGLIDDTNNIQSFSEPSIAVNQFNDVLIGYSRFSSNQYPSANYSFRYGTDPPGTLRDDAVLKAGEAPFTLTVDFLGIRVRWGDYSHTTVDPLNDTDLWTIQEYAASPANGEDRWGTWWGRIVPSGSFLTSTNVTVTEGDTGTTNAVFTFTLSKPTNVVVSVDYATVDGTARAGLDYVATSGTLVFAPGQTNQTIVVPILNDTIRETNETFFLALSNPTNVSQSYGWLQATILDNEPLPSISINDIAVREGDIGLTDANFTLSLSGESALPVTARLITPPGSATIRVDYVQTNIFLTFPPGATSLVATIKLIGDTLLESNETFFANLSVPTNAAIARAQGVCTILDDDFKVTLQYAAGGDVQLSFATQTNRNYRVERTDNLAVPIVWSSLPGSASVPGNGSIVTVLDPGALTQPKRFYRVLTQ